MKKLYFLTITLVLISFLNLNAQTILAEYPLTEDGVDITGYNNEMNISEAPFQNGGIYSNGIYAGNDENGSSISTPQIVGFNFDDLTIKVEFLIEEYPEHTMPIIMAGSSWRWLSAWMNEDKIALKVNNGSIYEISDVVVSLDQWHSVTISYNKVEGKARLHLNDGLILTVDVEEITNGENARITNYDGGSAKTYKGYWRNMEIHNTAVVANIEDNLMEDINIELYANKVQINIPYENNAVRLQMFDLSGRNIGEHNLIQGSNSLAIPKGNSIIMFVLTDQKGNRSVQKLGIIK